MWGFLFLSWVFLQEKVQKQIKQKGCVYWGRLWRGFWRAFFSGRGMQGRASKKIAKIPQPDYCLHVPTLVSQRRGRSLRVV